MKSRFIKHRRHKAWEIKRNIGRKSMAIMQGSLPAKSEKKILHASTLGFAKTISEYSRTKFTQNSFLVEIHRTLFYDLDLLLPRSTKPKERLLFNCVSWLATPYVKGPFLSLLMHSCHVPMLNCARKKERKAQYFTAKKRKWKEKLWEKGGPKKITRKINVKVG